MYGWGEQDHVSLFPQKNKQTKKQVAFTWHVLDDPREKGKQERNRLFKNKLIN